MVRISYKQLVRLLDTIDEKINQLEKDKGNERSRINSLPAFQLDESKEIKEVAEHKSRFDAIIEDFVNLRGVISAELDKIEFEFGVRDKWNQSNQQPQK